MTARLPLVHVTGTVKELPAGDTLSATTTGNAALAGSSSQDFATQNLNASGNVALVGNGRRITGDMSTATFANRVAFQTSTVDGPTSPEVLPNGTSKVAQMLFNNSSASNDSLLKFGINAATVFFDSNQRGSTTLPMAFTIGGATGILIDTSRNVSTGGPLTAGGYTVATLPAGTAGCRTHVTDSSVTTFGSTVAGGGSNTVPVFKNASNWVVG